MAMPVVVARVDGPKCRLLPVPAPIRRGCPAHRVPARFVLPMIVAPAERKPILGPDDLGAHVEAGSLKGLLDLARVPARVPDIGNRSGEQGPRIPPVGAIIVSHFAERAGVAIDAG